MTGRELLKKLRTLCYILGILGIIIGIVAITTNIGNTLFQELVKNIKVPENTNVDAKTYAGIYFIVESDIIKLLIKYLYVILQIKQS